MSTSSLPQLYGFWRSSASFRVRVALRLKGIAYEEKVVDLASGEQRGAAYLALNPQGALPLLVMPGMPPLSQSLAIIEFLDEFRPAPPLLPADPADRAWARSLAAMLAGDCHPLITPRVGGYLRQCHGFDDAAWAAWQRHWFAAGLRAFEQRLASARRSGDFCLGDTVGLADICLASIFAVMGTLGIAPPADLPLIAGIMVRLDRLPAFVESAPQLQPGAPATN